jgi:hypothetical protein
LIEPDPWKGPPEPENHKNKKIGLSEKPYEAWQDRSLITTKKEGGRNGAYDEYIGIFCKEKEGKTHA